MQKRRQQIPDTWRALRASESTQFRTSISSIKKRRRKRAWKGIPHTSGWLSQLGHLCLVPVEWNSLVSMTRSCLHNPHTSYPVWEKWVIIKYDTDSERIQLNCVCGGGEGGQNSPQHSQLTKITGLRVKWKKKRLFDCLWFRWIR